jgi:hypothetical protein
MLAGLTAARPRRGPAICRAFRAPFITWIALRRQGQNRWGRELPLA